jgi:hypothetical protein
MFAPLHRLEAPAALEIALHDRGDVETAVGGAARERHDRDGDRVRDALGDVDLQLRASRHGNAQQQQRRQHGGK